MGDAVFISAIMITAVALFAAGVSIGYGIGHAAALAELRERRAKESGGRDESEA